MSKKKIILFLIGFLFGMGLVRLSILVDYSFSQEATSRPEAKAMEQKIECETTGFGFLVHKSYVEEYEKESQRGIWNDLYENQEEKKIIALMSHGMMYCNFLEEDIAHLKYNVTNDKFSVNRYYVCNEDYYKMPGSLFGYFSEDFQTLEFEGTTYTKRNHRSNVNIFENGPGSYK